MKTIRVDLPKDLRTLELHPLADLHLGDQECDFQGIVEILKHIKETPNAYCILGGDLMDTAIASSIGDTYAASLNPMEQLKQCVKLFEPIKDKILCILPGNHERRVYKQDGIDLTAIMASQLGLSNKYSSTTAYLFIRFGWDSQHGRKRCYTLYYTHGSGGGRKEGGKINRLVDLSTICDADIYCMGHVHQPAILRTNYLRTDTSNSKVAQVEKLFINTAAALNYGGYGDLAGFKPSSKINPVIYMSGEKKRAWAEL